MKKLLLTLVSLLVAFSQGLAAVVEFNVNPDLTSVNNSSVSKENITLNFSKGSGSTAPRYYAATSSLVEAVRMYPSNTLTVSSTISITKIEFTYGSTITSTLTANTGNFSENTWTGKANDVTFTVGSETGKQRHISKIIVTTSDSGTTVLGEISCTANDGKTITNITNKGTYPGTLGTSFTFKADNATSWELLTETEVDDTEKTGAEFTWTPTIACANMLVMVEATGPNEQTKSFEFNLTLTDNSQGGGEEPTQNTYTDELKVSTFTSDGGTTYKDYEYTSKLTDITYTANMATNYANSFQFRSSSNSGLVTSANPNGYILKSIEIKYISGSNKADIYGKNSNYESAKDLYDTLTRGDLIGSLSSDGNIVPESDYTAFGLRSNSGALYPETITLVWEKPASGGEEPDEPTEKTDAALSFSADMPVTLEVGKTLDVNDYIVSSANYSGTYEYSVNNANASFEGSVLTANTAGDVEITVSVPEEDETYYGKAKTKLTITPENAEDILNNDKFSFTSSYSNKKYTSTDSGVVYMGKANLNSGNMQINTNASATNNATKSGIASIENNYGLLISKIVVNQSGGSGYINIEIGNTPAETSDEGTTGTSAFVNAMSDPVETTKFTKQDNTYTFVPTKEAKFFRIYTSTSNAAQISSIEVTYANKLGEAVYTDFKYYFESVDVPEGKTLNLFKDDDVIPTTLEFKIINPEIVSISKEGVITGLKEGYTDVTVSWTKDEINHFNASVEGQVFTVTVTEGLTATFDFTTENAYGMTSLSDPSQEYQKGEIIAEGGKVTLKLNGKYRSWKATNGNCDLRIYKADDNTKAGEMAFYVPDGCILEEIVFDGTNLKNITVSAGKLNSTTSTTTIWTPDEEQRLTSVTFKANGGTPYIKTAKVSYIVLPTHPLLSEEAKDGEIHFLTEKGHDLYYKVELITEVAPAAVKARVSAEDSHGDFTKSEENVGQVIGIVSGDTNDVHVFSTDALLDAVNREELADNEKIQITTFACDPETETHMHSITAYYYLDKSGIITGIDGVAVDSNSEAVYFNTQGVKVTNPEKGIFIKVQNGKAVKVVK